MKHLLLKLLIIFAAYILVSCSSKTDTNKQANEAESVTLPVRKITRSNVSIKKEYAANLKGSSVIEIRPQINGYLSNVLVKEGSYVHKGQILFEIDKRIYKSELNAAIANMHAVETKVTSAEIELKKLDPLVNNNVISKVQLATAQATHKQALSALKEAQSKIEVARANLDYSVIKAPFGGFLGLISKDLGSVVKTSDIDPLTVLTNTYIIYAYFSMSEVEFHDLYEKLPGKMLKEKTNNISDIYLKLPNGSIYKHTGKINMVNSQVDSNTGTITLRADFPNPSHILRSGSTAKVILSHDIPDLLAIPIKAVVDIQDKAFVYVVGKDNKAEQREIKINYRYNNDYIVSSGLQEGDRIITDGLNKVSPGQNIISSN